MKRTMLLTLILSGCAMVPGTDANKIAQAESKMRDFVKDGDSVKFKDERVVLSGSIANVCGMMNAKNSYNAYVGFTPFMVDQDGKVSVEGQPSPGMNEHDRNLIWEADWLIGEKCPTKKPT